MKNTVDQTTTKTLADLYRALDHRNLVTITYLTPGDTEPTVRSIETHDIRTTKNGSIVIVAMCRLRNEERQFHLSGILSYTVHRMAYVLDRPAPTKYVRPEPAPMHDEIALISYELARDPDDADYQPRVTLAA